MIGHDWLTDGQPASITYSDTGMILGRNIAGGIQIGMQFKAALPTHKTPTRTTVVAGDMPTARAAARLRGMSRINRNHRTTTFFGLVLDKTPEPGKRPHVYTAARCCFSSNLRMFQNIGQTLDHNSATWFDRLNNLLAQMGF